MKNIILATLLSTSLAACGAGSSGEAPVIRAASSVEVVPQLPQHTFNIVVLGKPSQAVGQGDTLNAAANDAVSKLMFNVFVPGTDAYRALVNGGLTVDMKDVVSGKGCVAQMKIGSDTRSVQVGCEI